MANYIGMYQYLWHPTPLFIFICVSVVRAFQGLKYSQNYMFSYEVLEFIVFCGCIYYLKALVPPPPWGLNQSINQSIVGCFCLISFLENRSDVLILEVWGNDPSPK